jgi:hypothetical protein
LINADNPVSVYARDYPAKKTEFDGKGIGTNPFRGSSIGVGKNDPNQFLTTNKIKYQEWKNCEKAQLDEKKAHELKTHHFSLGIDEDLTQETITIKYRKPLPTSIITTQRPCRVKLERTPKSRRTA